MIAADGFTYCDTCGALLSHGDYPFCPHGQTRAMINRDEIPGGVTVENYGPHPITFYSHSERRAYMKVHGLSEKETFCPTPGTDKDPQGIPNPAGYVDDVTMENRKALFLRNNNRRADPTPPDSTVTTGVMSGEEAADHARHTLDAHR